MLKIQRLICRIFGHDWATTHTNQWMVPAQLRCRRCRLERSMERIQGGRPFQMCWHYTNGLISAEFNPMDLNRDEERRVMREVEYK